MLEELTKLAAGSGYESFGNIDTQTWLERAADVLARCAPLLARVLAIHEILGDANAQGIRDGLIYCNEVQNGVPTLSTLEQIRRLYAFFKHGIMKLPMMRPTAWEAIERKRAESKRSYPFPPDDIGARTSRDFNEVALQVSEVVAKLRELKTRIHPYVVGEGDQASLEKSGLKKYLGDLEVTLDHAAFSANVAHKEAQRFVSITTGDNSNIPDAGGPAPAGVPNIRVGAAVSKTTVSPILSPPSEEQRAQPDPQYDTLISKAARETLAQLITVTWDGKLISKAARTALVDAGLVQRAHGFNWLTEAGVGHLVNMRKLTP